MKNTILLTCLILLMSFNLQGQQNRGMYVDSFIEILGDTNSENRLLDYVKSHEIKTLLLYDLYFVNTKHDLSRAKTNSVLANFIRRAKTNYGVLFVGATGENAQFFTNIIDPYNNSRTNSLEKIDIYNLEFEFWNVEAEKSANRVYYCETYLKPNTLPCTIDGAFQFSISVLKTMNSLAKNNSHPITTEAYISGMTSEQLKIIGNHVDRLLLCTYKNNPTAAFINAKKRIKYLAKNHPNVELSILFSSEPEPSFMGSWLANNSMMAAEKVFNSYLKKQSSDNWKSNVNLVGFTYFSYFNCKDLEISLK